MIKISVIIPVYNTGSVLKRTVKSILSQSFSEVEILLMNDGSTEMKTLQICNDLSEKDSRIKVFHQENKGIEKTRLEGIKNAKGKYFMFLDHDDVYLQNALKLLWETAENHQADIVIAKAKHQVFPGIYSPNNTPFPIQETVVSKEEFLKKWYLNFFGVNYFDVATWGKLYRTELMKSLQVQTFGYNFMEDVILNAQLFLQAEKIMFLPKVVYKQYYGGLSSKNNADMTLKGYLNTYPHRKMWLEQNGLASQVKYLHFEIKNVIIQVFQKWIEYKGTFEQFSKMSEFILNHPSFREAQENIQDDFWINNLTAGKHELNYNLLLKENNSPQKILKRVLKGIIS